MATPDQVIQDQAIAPGRYDILESPPDGWTPTANTAIPLADYLARRDQGADLTGVGVVLFGDTDMTPLQAVIADVPFVAVSFPKFTDGRGYSHARRLRDLWSYSGDIVAYGDVLRDQMFYMHRCGINVFHMAGGSDLRGALNAFDLYTRSYQYNP